MNTLQSLSQTLKKWQKNYSRYQRQESQQKRNETKSSTTIKKETSQQPLWFRLICKVHPPVMIILSITTMTGVVSYRFYNQPELGVGTISPTRIIAPGDGTFVDEKTTEDLRRNTRSGLLPTLKEDENITQNIKLTIQEQLNTIDEAREVMIGNPIINTGILSSEVQQYLRSAPQDKWQKIVNNRGSLDTLTGEDANFVTSVEQLKVYQQQVIGTEFENLINQIATQRSNYQVALHLLTELPEIRESDAHILLNLDQQQWQESKIKVNTIVNQILTQGIPFGLPQSIRTNTIETHLSHNFPSFLQPTFLRLIDSNLRSNLIIDETETRARAERAAQEIDSIVVSVQKDEVIVDVGERITQADFVLLDNFGLSRRSINWMGVMVSGALSGGSVFIFMAIAHRKNKGRLRRRDQFLWWLFSLSVPFISLFDVSYNSLPAVGFLMSTFYGPTVAVTNVTLSAGLTLFQTGGIGWEYLISSYASSLLAAMIAGRLRSREELALLGGGVGLTQGAVYFVATLASGATVGTFWYAIIPGAIWHGAVGLTYGVLALGISPYLERFFDLITPIRLAELSNPNRPMLKRLATEAPGTFQHTMFVANLAEAAAQKLNCNVELVRAGTLYHDIGKMHDPLGFIENQMGSRNKHEDINDPWKSADIIKKHVSEGIVMAKKCGLPQAIQNFIPEHQGTLLISYFYYQAKKQGEEDSTLDIDESIFRYDGPIPQSRETGIVMLADGCEAALRSLKGATPDQAMAMINKIFKARWRDRQLEDSGLKYEELPIIAEVFVTVWQQSNHERIVYPKGALEMKPSQK